MRPFRPWRHVRRRPGLVAAVCVLFLLTAGDACAETWRLGTWKTAQTLQPYAYAGAPGEDVEIRVFPFTNPADQKAALLAGSLDMAGTTLALAIQAAARGEPVVLVASLCGKCSALVVGRDSGITMPEQLRGKRIAYVPGTMHEVLLRDLLRRHGLDARRDVQLLRVDFFDMNTALARGDADAYLSGEPLPAQAVRRGVGRILAYPYFDDSIGTINSGLLVHKELVTRDPERVRRMVAAHKRATEQLCAEPQGWLDAAARLTGLERELLEQAASNMELTWDMDTAFLRRLAALGARMKALGLIAREPDYAALVDTRFVNALRTPSAGDSAPEVR